MNEPKSKIEKKKIDTKEFAIPETLYIRDIENKVFQSIVLHCLEKIPGISLLEGSFIDHVLGRDSEGIKGISAEQDDKNQEVNIKVEVNLLFGHEIPEKAEEIQTKITQEITKLTGLHVASVHVIFKNVISHEQAQKLRKSESFDTTRLGEDYSDEF